MWRRLRVAAGEWDAGETRRREERGNGVDRLSALGGSRFGGIVADTPKRPRRMGRIRARDGRYSRSFALRRKS